MGGELHMCDIEAGEYIEKTALLVGVIRSNNNFKKVIIINY